MRGLLQHLGEDIKDEPSKDHICQGTLLSLLEYLHDLKMWSYQDARLKPTGNMTVQEIIQMTSAFIKV